MFENVSKTVVIQQDCEDWLGAESVPRAKELLGIGLSKRAVASRFRKKNGKPITTAGLDKAIARYESEHRGPPPDQAAA